MFLPLLYNKFCNRHTDTVCYSLYFFLLFLYPTAITTVQASFQRYIFLTLLLIACSTGVSQAQYTIRRPTAESSQRTAVFDGSRPSTAPKNNYFDPAAERARKLRLRKERNTIEFNASLETSLQQFENWTGSGSNNFYALGNIFFRHQYKRQKLSIDYRIEANYGLNFIDDAFFKNKDEFKINWQLGWQMHRYWSYSTSFSIRSQFSPGYESRTDHTLVSDFMSPGYFDISAGFSYTTDNSPITITLSPFSGNIVTVINPTLSAAGEYGVKNGEKVVAKLGYSANVFFDKSFFKKQWLRYRTELYVFIPYIEFDNPTIRWENTLEIKISRYISTKLYGQLYYRKEDSTALQYQYAFLIGLKYTFRNK